MDLSEEQVLEERDPNLNEDEDIRTYEIRDNHWRDVAEEGDDKNNIHDLRWDVYVKEEEELTKRDFLVSVPYTKGGNIDYTNAKRR